MFNFVFITFFEKGMFNFVNFLKSSFEKGMFNFVNFLKSSFEKFF